jgi:hypothetical protein
MPLLALGLLLAPLQLQPRQLMWLAFSIWITGGVFLMVRALQFWQQLPPEAAPDPGLWLGVVAASAAVGMAKGRFVLNKTSQRNIDRLRALAVAQRPYRVYSVRSWVMIALMVMISLSLTLFNAPLLWRGAVNLAVGLALVTSSLAYLRALQNSVSSSDMTSKPS